MTPFDPISPPADYPQSAKIITLHRRVPVRASADLLPPVGRRVSPAPPELVAQVRRDDAAFNRFERRMAIYNPPSFAERLVLFMRLNGEALTFWFAMGAIGLLVAVVAAAYMRGAL